MSFPVTLTADDMNAFDTLDMLPLRQMVHVTRATAGLSGRLLGELSRPDRFRILRHGPGAQILARNGLALAEAQVALRNAYGLSIGFGPPTIHRVIDHATGATLVPMMFLRVDAPRAFRRELLQILAERSTGPSEIDMQRDRIVFRAESPLACVIGMERQIVESTDGAAQIMYWLSRYCDAPRDPNSGKKCKVIETGFSARD